MDKITRRGFLKAAGAAAATLSARGAEAAAPAQQSGSAANGAPLEHGAHAGNATSGAQRTMYLFFNAQEAAFIEAAVARLIPDDELGPGALEVGVPNYIDKQLAGAWGTGERLYCSGPWREGTPSQGYQLPFTPAELFRNALRAMADAMKREGRKFAKLDRAAQDQYLKSLEQGEADLGGVPSKVFFESLLAMTIEGYFSDPVYGGNRDMASWRMIGFPGAYANFYDLVDKHGVAYTRVPMSLAENAEGHIAVHPDIPAHVDGKRK
jgi:gluconate 2-dehydrogenase gamma chain